MCILENEDENVSKTSTNIMNYYYQVIPGSTSQICCCSMAGTLACKACQNNQEPKFYPFDNFEHTNPIPKARLSEEDIEEIVNRIMDRMEKDE